MKLSWDKVKSTVHVYLCVELGIHMINSGSTYWFKPQNNSKPEQLLMLLHLFEYHIFLVTGMKIEGVENNEIDGPDLFTVDVLLQ